MKRYMAHILVSTEKITEHFLKVQVHDEGTLADGGMEGLVVDVLVKLFCNTLFDKYLTVTSLHRC